MKAYYNEIDPKAAAWLRELIKAGLIADGDVDERSIEDVIPSEVKDYTQCHYFAGIGVWSFALRQAGWSDNKPVWTGSCPCQPFSSAGKGKGVADERHLWPAFHHLIRECQPVTVFGEQVANKAGESWFDIVSSDLEAEGYAAGLAVFPACGVGAPHQRKRLYWAAKSLEDTSKRRAWGQHRAAGEQGRDAMGRRTEGLRQGDWAALPNGMHSDGSACSMGNSTGPQTSPQQQGSGQAEAERSANLQCGSCSTGSMADTNNEYERPTMHIEEGATNPLRSGETNGSSPTNGHWRDADWLGCRDGKWRPVEPGTFPLANGAPARVGRLRGYGNAIVAQQAQAFIEVYMEEVQATQ